MNKTNASVTFGTCKNFAATNNRDGITRKKLNGSSLKKKIQRVKSRNQRSSLLADEQEYHGDGSEHDVFEELVFEMSLDTLISPDDVRDELIIEAEDGMSYCSSDISSSFEELPSIGSCSSSYERISLDGTVSIPKNSVCEDLLRSLLDPDTPELFLRATYMTPEWNCVPAVNRYMHSGGDLHTAYNAILSWISASQTNNRANIKEWSQLNGIHTGALKKVMRAIKGLSMEDVNKAFDNLSDTIYSMFKSQIAVSNGHINAGFKMLSSEEGFYCCASSSIRLLEHLPKYVIYTPRHTHSDGHTCYHLTPIPEDKVHKLITSILLDFEDECCGETVSLTSAYILGRIKRERLRATWPKDSPFVLTDTDSHTISMLTSTVVKKNAWKFLDERIQEIKDAHVKKTEIYSYPPGTDTILLAIGNGGICNQVSIEPKVSNTNNKIYQIKEFVPILVEFNVSTWNFVGENQLKDMCTKFVSDKFSELQQRDFLVQVHQLSPDAKFVPVTIVFTSHVTARRGLRHLTEDDSATITNQEDIDKALRTFRVYIHKDLMAVIGENINHTLRKLTKSPKYCVEYSMHVDDERSMVMFEISFQSSKVMKIDGLKACLRPLVFKLTKPTPMRQRLSATSTVAPVLSMFSYLTETYIHIPVHTDEVHIYGDRTAGDNALHLVEEYLKLPKNVWKCIGKPKLVGGELPNEVTFHVMKAIREQTYKDITGAVFIDKNNKNFWIFTPDKEIEFGVMIQRTEKVLIDIIQNVYDFQIPLDLISFDIPAAVEIECGICYSVVDGKPYITEACGHVYCMDCLRSQIKAMLSSGSLPLACGECDCEFSLEDISNVMSVLGVPRQQKFLKCAINKYMAGCHDTKRFCPKPECLGIVNIDTTDLLCGVCGGQLCPECLDGLHMGMSCERYQEYGKWMAADPANRKYCPKCAMGIEKVGGCNNVSCVFCKSSICWVCLKGFSSSLDCYNHMDTQRHW